MAKGVKSILITSPTGSGKTALTAEMLRAAVAKGTRSLFICHRQELLSQSVKTFKDIGIDVGVIASGQYYNPRKMIHVASVQTLVRRLDKIKPPKLLVFDECHHQGAKTWAKIATHWPGVYRIGLTGSPWRLDGKGLGKWYEKIVAGPSVSWLIENKFLAKYKLFAPANINFSDVHTRMGDFVKAETELIMDKPTITGSAIEEYTKYMPNKRAIVFCVSCKHSENVAKQFNASGIPAMHVDGKTPSHIRKAAIAKLKTGEIKVISSVELFIEGLDVPSLDGIIMLRPTQSLSLFLQMIGRALRPHDDKDHAIILDHVRNYLRHGLPDQDHEWSLRDRERKSMKKVEETNSKAIKICPVCFAAQKVAPLCSFCGAEMQTEGRKIEEVDGELTEIDTVKLKVEKRREQSGAKSVEELVELGRSRGYKNPRGWANHIFAARSRKSSSYSRN